MIYSKTNFCVLACLVLFLCGTYAFSQEPTAPSNVVAKDTPNDDGTSITVTWDAAPEDILRMFRNLLQPWSEKIHPEEIRILGYVILRNTDEGEYKVIGGEFNPDLTKYKDTNIVKGKAHAYIVRAIYGIETSLDSSNLLFDFLFRTYYSDSAETAGVKASGQWFHTGKTPLFLAMLIFSTAIVWNIYHARSGREVFIRRIPGLEAVEEAIGRATEMGRSILYVLGLGGVDNVATIASMTILGQVARRTADYETSLRVPCNDPIVLNVVREMVKTSYLDVGRPDAYNEDDIFFLTTDQFAYAAGVDGMMIREKPAAVFLQGQFYAESLLMAETGNSIGAIQIAGTDSEHQLPFFIAACDYTLIGEELYAASAYLSREPMLLGSLKGQDWGKLLIFAALVLGISLEFFGINWITTLLRSVS